jgi:hypothetical protein
MSFIFQDELRLISLSLKSDTKFIRGGEAPNFNHIGCDDLMTKNIRNLP